jgi:hypothetical protein
MMRTQIEPGLAVEATIVIPSTSAVSAAVGLFTSRNSAPTEKTVAIVPSVSALVLTATSREPPMLLASMRFTAIAFAP